MQARLEKNEKMRRNYKDAFHSQRLGQDQKFCAGGMESTVFTCIFANMMKQGELVRKAKSSSVTEIPSDSWQSYIA